MLAHLCKWHIYHTSCGKHKPRSLQNSLHFPGNKSVHSVPIIVVRTDLSFCVLEHKTVNTIIKVTVITVIVHNKSVGEILEEKFRPFNMQFLNRCLMSINK